MRRSLLPLAAVAVALTALTAPALATGTPDATPDATPAATPGAPAEDAGAAGRGAVGAAPAATPVDGEPPFTG